MRGLGLALMPVLLAAITAPAYAQSKTSSKALPLSREVRSIIQAERSAVLGGRIVSQASGSAEGDTMQLARRGMDVLMNGDPEEAIHIFQRIQQQDPDSAVGFLLEADATWWKIYLTIGNLVDPDVFDVAKTQKSPYDARFEAVLSLAIRKAEANIRSRSDLPRNYLYEGLAYGLRARFTGLRDSDLPTARAGKKMRSLLLQALKMDSGLNDAYLGLGIYNYFVDTLPSIVKLLKFLIALPGGNREVGIQQLRRAAERAELVHGEAKFYLAKDYSRRAEQQDPKSLTLFQELEREYPRNMLWKLLVGSLEIRLGRTEAGEREYREVLTTSSNAQSQAGHALHSAAVQALSRRHPREQFE